MGAEFQRKKPFLESAAKRTICSFALTLETMNLGTPSCTTKLSLVQELRLCSTSPSNFSFRRSSQTSCVYIRDQGVTSSTELGRIKFDDKTLTALTQETE